MTEVGQGQTPPATDVSQGNLYLFLALAAGSGSSYLFHLMMTRLLGPAEYGALGSLLGLILVLGVPVAGVQAVVARRIAVTGSGGPEDHAGVIRSGLRGSALVGCALAAALAGTAGWTASYLKTGSVLPVILVALLVIPSLVTPVGRGALQGLVRFRALGSSILVHAVLRVSLGTLLVVAGMGLSGAMVGLVVAEVIGLVLAFAPLRDVLQGRRGRPAVTSSLLPETLGASSTLLAFWFLATTDVLLVRHYFPAASSGRFAAIALVGKAVLFAATAVAMVAYPRFAKGGSSADTTLRIAVRAVLLIGAVAASGVALLPGLLTVVLGDAYGATGATAPLLALAGTGFGVAALLIYRQLAVGRVRLRALWLALPIEVAAISLFHSSLTTVAGICAGTAWVVAGVLWVRRPRTATSRPVPQGELWMEDSSETVLSVITPTYNGGRELGANIRELLSVLRRSQLRHEVIVVSDGSNEETVREARAYAPEGVRLIHYEENRGKGHALRTGLATASGRYVALIDSDGDLDPADLVRFLKLMELYEADMVVGSKRHPLSEVSYPISRRVLSWAYHRAVRLLFRINVRDTQAGIKLIRREVLAEILPRLVEKRFAFDLELMVAARRAGHRRIMEAPIRLRYRFTSTVSRGAMVAMARDTLGIWYRRYVARAYEPIPLEALSLPNPVRPRIAVAAVEAGLAGE